ncbi:DUF47 family protein [bacterium]|nr:MAG: DUF47 family protein [bacterium]
MLKLGHDVEFFKLLESQAEVAQRAAKAFVTFCQDFTGLEAQAEILKELEHEGDEMTRTLQSKILSTFMTPLDKEDLRSLSNALDDVTDAIEAAASRAALYHLESSPRGDLAPMAVALLKMCDLNAAAVGELRKNIHGSETFASRIDEIHRLENEGDALHRKALVNLFDTPSIDPLVVVKWKEVYDITEDAFDVAEHVAKVLGDILIKYA